MKKLKKNPVFSYALIAVAYIIAAAAGILIVRAMTAPDWVKLLIADIAATVIIFIFSTLFKNSSIYDPYWSVQPIVIVFVLAFTYKLSFIRFLMIAAITIWGIRLTANWAIRFRSLKYEDWRYVKLRKASGSLFPVVNFAGIHLIPTVIVYLCMLPAVAAFNTDSSFSLISIIFFVTAMGGVFLEAYADYHMNLFKKDEADGYASGCCRYGLWRNARHPNYLGEQGIWLSLYLFVIGAGKASHGIFHLSFIGPLFLVLLFMGSSMLGESISSGKYPRYKDYIKQVFKYVPLKKFSPDNKI